MASLVSCQYTHYFFNVRTKLKAVQETDVIRMTCIQTFSSLLNNFVEVVSHGGAKNKGQILFMFILMQILKKGSDLSKVILAVQ